MRITLAIGADVLAAARALAERRGISFGKAVSELARRGYRQAPIAGVTGDGTMFAVPADAEPMTIEDVHRALED